MLACFDSRSQLQFEASGMTSTPRGQRSMPADGAREVLFRHISTYTRGQQQDQRGPEQTSRAGDTDRATVPQVLETEQGELDRTDSAEEAAQTQSKYQEQDVQHRREQLQVAASRDSIVKAEPCSAGHLNQSDRAVPAVQQPKHTLTSRSSSPVLTCSTLDFATLPNATGDCALGTNGGHAPPGAANNARPQPRSGQHSLPFEWRAPARYSDRLAEGLVLVPRGDEPESPWSMPSPFLRAPKSAASPMPSPFRPAPESAASPMPFRVPHAIGTGARFLSRSELRQPALSFASHPSEGRQLPVSEDRQPHSAAQLHVPAAVEAPQPQRHSLPAAELSRPNSVIHDHLAEIMRPPKRRRSSLTAPRGVSDRLEVQQKSLTGEQTLSFAYMAQQQQEAEMADEISVGKAAQARGLTKSSSAKAAATAGKAAAGPRGKVLKSTKAAQKREDKQSAKGAAKPDTPSPWQMTGLEQLANAASWQAEKEHISVGGPEPSQDQSTVSELQTVHMSHSKGSATQSRELGALDSTGRGGLQLHLTDTPSEGSGAARQHAPSAAVPATSAPAEVRAATAAVPAGAPGSAPGKCQQHEDSCEPAQDAASLQPGPERSGRGPASGGVPAGELPALASGGIPPHSLADQEFVMSSAYEAPPGSITAMRGFHSDPAASMAYRPEQCHPIRRGFSADMMLPKARNAAPLPSLMPGRPSSQMTAAAPQEISEAALALHAGANVWSGRVRHRLGTAEGRSTVELFTASAAFPADLLEQLPPVIFVNELASRDQVRLRRHSMHPVQLAQLTQKQHAKLMSLAAMKLVGMARLQHYDLLFVIEADAHKRVQVIMIAQTDDVELRQHPTS